MDFAAISIPNPRPLYPEHLGIAAPLGTRERLRRAAQKAGVSSAAFVREALEAKLRQVDVAHQPEG